MKDEKTINLIKSYRERINKYYEVKRAVVLSHDLRDGLEEYALWLKKELDKLVGLEINSVEVHKELVGESYIYNNSGETITITIYDCLRYRYFNKVGDLADWFPGLKRKRDMRLMEYKCNDVYIKVNKGKYKYSLKCSDRGLIEKGSIEEVF